MVVHIAKSWFPLTIDFVEIVIAFFVTDTYFCVHIVHQVRIWAYLQASRATGTFANSPLNRNQLKWGGCSFNKHWFD